MRSLQLEKAALKALVELATKQFRQVVTVVFELLREPQPHFSKQLQGYPYCRLAVSEYRVIYRFDASTVTILAFGKRNDGEVYRRLS